MNTDERGLKYAGEDFHVCPHAYAWRFLAGQISFAQDRDVKGLSLAMRCRGDVPVVTGERSFEAAGEPEGSEGDAR